MTDVSPSAGYITYPLEQDSEAMAEAAFQYISDRVAGWDQADGNLETILIEALSQQAADLAEVAATVPESVFKYFGESLLGLPQKEAVPASAHATWTMIDAAGYTVPAGTAVDQDGVGFETVNEFTVQASSTSELLVVMQAVEEGAAGNGLVGDATPLDPLDFVAAVELTSVSSGGVEGESDEAYLDRLAELLQTLSPRPILPRDFALIAQSVAGVYRATAIDLLDPVTPDTNSLRSVTVAVVAEDGQPVGVGTKAAVDDLLQASREISFQVFVIDPTYTSINVDVGFTVVSGFGLADVAAAVADAVERYLSPSSWGLLQESLDVSWTNEKVVRYLEVASAVNAVAGVDYVEYLHLNGNVYGDDVALSGYAPLPEPGTINAVVV